MLQVQYIILVSVRKQSRSRNEQGVLKLCACCRCWDGAACEELAL